MKIIRKQIKPYLKPSLLITSRLNLIKVFFTSAIIVALPHISVAGGAFTALRAPFEARLAALGGGVSAERASLSAEEINPASLVKTPFAVSLSVARFPVEIVGGRSMVTLSWNKVVLGLRYHFLNYGSIPESRVDEGNTGIGFTAEESLWGLRVASSVSKSFYWGLGINLMVGRIGADRASGWSGDLGIIWDSQWEGFLLGIGLRNYGKLWNNYGSITDLLSKEWVIGTSKRLQHLPLTFHLTFRHRQKDEGEWGVGKAFGSNRWSFNGGGEFEISSGSGYPIYLRLGYQSVRDQLRAGNQRDALAGISFGLGVNTAVGSWDYAYSSWGVGGEVHRIGWRYSKKPKLTSY
ncbi:MAG: hypothetical protein ACK4OO_02730 [bacterium]